ncbi:class I SAM-dependent methyltransferase [Candidatus Acetothermia bacterium]|nr:class I SAM-dependent methyltransferase [Candidatus Acetothermia bacterium]MBI3643883.1 class I SAM-dependent methyltransferase [Candidatus Acetothermia bacterium]
MKQNKTEQEIHNETQQIWDEIAPFWDEFMGEGGSFQKVLIGPATEKLLEIKSGERVLDIACGNGAFSRRMAALGAHVAASDFSQKFIELARTRTTENRDRIEYHIIDATDEKKLLSLGAGKFDAAVCTMAMMDMSTIDPLMSALSKLLRPGGRFVFSVMHPCFNSTGITQLVEQEFDDDLGEVTRYAITVSRYIHPETKKGIGIQGQPANQYYFHRPLWLLFESCFRQGFVIDGLLEPEFGESFQAKSPLGWANYKEIPAVLVARMRLNRS